MTKTVLAIDPGSKKCGLALVRRESNNELTLLWRKIAPSEDLIEAIDEAIQIEQASVFVVGSGTQGKQTVQRLRTKWPATAILSVDEKDTTLQARERYWEFNPRRGWRRLLPSTLQVPPVPIDDFAAFILAERVLL
ncbi:MAG: Holliday junction resolvase RuvX [Armatimonadetes bacterium]|nr:Holliday junction resolvase RuvX [Armatimonadota bacterium]